jgi:DNA-directed RNA polymerase specialized sigma subunit
MQKTSEDQLFSVENLKTLPDIVLVDNLKAGSPHASEILSVLSDRHSGLYISTVHKITGSSVPNLREDLMRDRLYVLYQAVQSYDPNRGAAFSTHFANEAKWNCLKNKTKKSNRELPCEGEFLDSLVNENAAPDDSEAQKDHEFFKSLALSEIHKIEDKRAKKILMMRYFSREDKNNPWKNIAEAVQLSIQGCINIHDKWMAIIRRNIQRNTKEITV